MFFVILCVMAKSFSLSLQLSSALPVYLQEVDVGTTPVSILPEDIAHVMHHPQCCNPGIRPIRIVYPCEKELNPSDLDDIQTMLACHYQPRYKVHS